MIAHPFPPLYYNNSKILILGSFPSVKSREQNFFYGHPKNRFWKVVSIVYGLPEPILIEEKRALAKSCGFAMWDVIASCEITGSSDSSIKNVVPNDLSDILCNSDVKHIYVNGKTAEKFYIKYQQAVTGIKAVCLPSTSPANAAWSLDKLVDKWKIITRHQ